MTHVLKPFFDVLSDAVIRFSEKHMRHSSNLEKLGKFIEKSSFIEFSTLKYIAFFNSFHMHFSEFENSF